MHLLPPRHAERPRGGVIQSASRPAQQASERDRAMGKRTPKVAGIGSPFDDFLKNERIYEETNAVAIKRVLNWQEKGKQENLGPSSTSSGRMRG